MESDQKYGFYESKQLNIVMALWEVKKQDIDRFTLQSDTQVTTFISSFCP